MSNKNAVLVLNASYEPVQTMSVQQAFINYFNGKCYIEEYRDQDVWHSAKAEHPVPSVIRLKEYKSINKKKRLSATKRSRIYIRDQHRCGYCGKVGKDKELTLDHIIPRCKRKEYGEEVINSPENLVTCCFSCNQIKKDHMLEECGMKLLHPPKQLKVGLDKVVTGHWAREKPDWAKYLFQSSEGDASYYE